MKHDNDDLFAVPMQTLNKTIQMLAELALTAGYPREAIDDGETPEWFYLIKARLTGDTRPALEVLDGMEDDIMRELVAAQRCKQPLF
jgi:hypothetical protein